jgi:hypothetical protein
VRGVFGGVVAGGAQVYPKDRRFRADRTHPLRGAATAHQPHRAVSNQPSSSTVSDLRERRHSTGRERMGSPHPADTSGTNLASTLGLLSRWRLSKPLASLSRLQSLSLSEWGTHHVQHPAGTCDDRHNSIRGIITPRTLALAVSPPLPPPTCSASAAPRKPHQREHAIQRASVGGGTHAGASRAMTSPAPYLPSS